MQFKSITHLHLYAAINTILTYSNDYKSKSSIRILDVGCGSGLMLSFFVQEIGKMHPTIKFSFFGIDVDDSSVQQKGYFSETIKRLQEADPDTVWEANLKLISSKNKWPFSDGYFDFIISNQVLEHVFNHSFFFSELQRTLNETGVAIHLFPLKHTIYEPHLFIPFVHRFKSWSTTYNWIRFFSFFSIGIYPSQKKAELDNSISGFSERHADYLSFQVNYLTARGLAVLAKSQRLKLSFDFTTLFYIQKLRSVLRMKPIKIYRKSSINSFRNSCMFFFLKYANNVTLLLRKKDAY